MSNQLHTCHCPGRFEIALSRKDLRVRGKYRILEKRSTKGFREFPKVKYPRKYVSSNRLIQTDQNWCIESKWKVSGPLACILPPGYWLSKIYFELMGGGEVHYSPESVVQDLGKDGHTYKTRIEIDQHSLKHGIYRIVCCTQYYIKKGVPGPIVGFHDLGLVKIYEDKNKKENNSFSDLALVENGTRQ